MQGLRALLAMLFLPVTIFAQEKITGTVQDTIAVKQLREITITHKKALLKNTGEKLIYNAHADISNVSGAATDVLRKVPMVTVGADGEVKIRGNSNFKILLNGVPSDRLSRNLKETLKMIPASTIESIEVITTPSAKYEAEGAGGIINIITKKTIKGRTGNIDLTAGNLERSVDAAINIAQNKFEYSLNVNARQQREQNNSTLDRIAGTGKLLQNNNAITHEKSANVDAGINYRLDSSQKLSVTTSLWHGSWPSTSTLYNHYQDQQEIAEYNQASRQTNSDTWLEFALNYQKKFHRKGQELQLLAEHARSAAHSEYQTNQYHLNGQQYFRETSPNKSKIRKYNFQADYAHPFNKSGTNLLETGSRYSRNNSSSSYTVYNNAAHPGSTDLIEVPSRSDVMQYHRDIFAIYLSTKFDLTHNWILKSGLRYEHTQLGASFRGPSPAFAATFNNFVPSILLTKQLHEKHNFKINYTERIRRPWIWDLNPYVNASDPRNLTSGNPALKPEVTKMLELGHGYTATNGFTLNSSLYYTVNNNAIEQLTTVDSQGISRTTAQNIAANKRLGININTSIEISENWTLSGGAEAYHIKFKSQALNVRNDGNFYAVNLNSSYILPHDYTISISGDYSNGNITLQGNTSANYSYRISAQKELIKKKASIVLGIANPFQRTFRQYSYATAPTFQSTTTNNFYNRAITLSFSWKFGN